MILSKTRLFQSLINKYLFFYFTIPAFFISIANFSINFLLLKYQRIINNFLRCYNNLAKFIQTTIIFNFISHMSEHRKPILILDANAFISCSKITQLGKNHRLITTSDVVAELRDQKTKEYFEKIPFEIQERNFDEKSLQLVKQFAKKTGDIGSLSDVDMELIALAHTLYVEQGLSSKLRKQPLPIVQKVVEVEEQAVQEQDSEQQEDQDSETEEPLDDQEGWIKVPQNKKKAQEEQDSDIDDQQGWITPNNYTKKMAEINTSYVEEKPSAKQSTQNKLLEGQQNQQQAEQQEEFSIALISADFAIQNVSTHMGIKLISLDGRVISSIRRFIWECYLCWKQFNVVQNKIKLCSGCGYNSLSKISYSMDMNGNVILHRKKDWKPNQKVQEWKQKKFQQQQRKKKHQHERRKKKQSIFDTV